MNAKLVYRTQEFLKEMKEVERQVLDLATSRGLGKSDEEVTLLGLAHEGEQAEKAFRELGIAVESVFAQAKRLLGVSYFHEVLSNEWTLKQSWGQKQ